MFTLCNFGNTQIYFYFLCNTCHFYYDDLVLFNNTFLLVKSCFTKPAVTLQSSIKAGTVDKFVNRMSVNDRPNQTNAQISEQIIASGGYGSIGAEEIKPMELRVCAPGEDANDQTKEGGISVSITRMKRQLTEKRKQYQINFLLDRRTKMVAKLQRKARAIDDLLYSSSNHVAVKQ